VDVVLNCQLTEVLWLGAGGPEGGLEGGLEGRSEVPGPPPHPHSSTRIESKQVKLDKRLVRDFIGRPPGYEELVVSSLYYKTGALYKRSVAITNGT
jgi:hypothetical protein